MTTKLSILNPEEYDLWLMRIEYYFLMTDYSLCEVIMNGNKVMKKTVGTSEETYEPTLAKEKLDRRNKMKSKGTLLMALPNKDQLKFHSYQNAKLLMEAIEKSVSVDVISNIAPSDVKTVKTIDVNHKGVFSTEEPKPVIKNNFSPPIIEDWHSDDKSEEEISPTVEVKTVKPSVEKIKYVKPAKETVKTKESPKQHKHHLREKQ
nr:hypothetical protein [Tanacetum cinerariifolium]